MADFVSVATATSYPPEHEQVSRTCLVVTATPWLEQGVLECQVDLDFCCYGRAVLGVANQVWANEVVMDYLREGRYEYSTPIPGQGNIKYVVSKPRAQANMVSMTRRLSSFALLWSA